MKRSLLALILLILFASNVYSATWDEVLTLARKNSNEIKSAQKQVESSKWSYFKSYTNFLPQLSASAAQTRTDSSTISSSHSYGLSASIPLFRGFSNYFNVQSSYLEYIIDEANLRKTESDYLYNVRLAFITLFTAQENIEVQKKILAERTQNEKLIKLMYDSGREDKGNYLKTEAQVKEATYNLVAAKRDLELARFNISELLNFEITSVESDYTISDIKGIDLQALASYSPSYLMSKYTLDLADLQKKSTVSEFLPNITLSGSTSKSDSVWPPQNSSNSVSLSMSYPFFPGGANIADYAINSANLDKAKEDFKKAWKDLTFRIKNAFFNLLNAIDSYSVQKTFLAASTERARISQAQYMNGLITYDEWDRIQNEFIGYQRSELTSRRTAQNAEAALYNSYGGYVK